MTENIKLSLRDALTIGGVIFAVGGGWAALAVGQQIGNVRLERMEGHLGRIDSVLVAQARSSVGRDELMFRAGAYDEKLIALQRQIDAINGARVASP